MADDVSEYETLCAERDAILAQCADLRAKRAAAVAREMAAREEAMECALAEGRIKGQHYIDLKRRIGQLAGRR